MALRYYVYGDVHVTAQLQVFKTYPGELYTPFLKHVIYL